MQHEPSMFMTKMTATSPGGDCPLWIKFLADVTDDNRELQDFLQRLCGYCLSGETSEHAIFFFYGTGANGKSVFLNTIAAILDDYAKAAPIETFTESRGDRHSTGIAGLQGARLVTAIETEQGRHWAESTIKTLTGGDTIAARFMRQRFFRVSPTIQTTNCRQPQARVTFR